MTAKFTPEKLDINHNKHDLSYLDNQHYEYIEVPPGYWVNCGKLLNINPQRDQEPELLSSSAEQQRSDLASRRINNVAEKPDGNAKSTKQEHDAAMSGKLKLSTPCTSTTHKAPESGKVANSPDSGLGTELQSQSVEVIKNNPISSSLGTGALDTSQSSITDDQPKALLQTNTHHNPPPSAASSICEPPDNSEFKSNPSFKNEE